MNRSPDGIGICRITNAETSLPPADIGRAVTTELAMVPSASAMESMSFASRSDLIASSSEATTRMAPWSGETGVPPSLGWVAVMSARLTPSRSSLDRARIFGAVRSCWTIRPVRSMPRISVRTEGDAVGLTVTGGAFRLTFLPGVTGDSWMFVHDALSPLWATQWCI